MIEETAQSKDDRTLLPVFFATPPTQLQSTSPNPDSHSASHGAQISSDYEEKTVSLILHFLLTQADVLHLFNYKGTPLTETADRTSHAVGR
jgi:hypothetical protein